jgi:hypothetical protein
MSTTQLLIAWWVLLSPWFPDECPAYKFIEKFFTYRFVMGLRAEFDAIRTCLLHGSATLTMSAALSDLLAEETRLQSLTDSNDSVPHSVLACAARIRRSACGYVLDTYLVQIRIAYAVDTYPRSIRKKQI